MRVSSIPRVLALAPGTLHLGIALFEGEELIKFGVKTFQGKKSSSTLLPRVIRFLDELYAAHCPNVLAVEKVFYAQARSSALLCAEIAAIKRWAEKKGLCLKQYVPTTVKEYFCEQKRSRRALAQSVARRYSFLTPYLKSGRTHRAQFYWQQMFDAVALGGLALATVSGTVKMPRAR